MKRLAPILIALLLFAGCGGSDSEESAPALGGPGTETDAGKRDRGGDAGDDLAGGGKDEERGSRSASDGGDGGAKDETAGDRERSGGSSSGSRAEERESRDRKAGDKDDRAGNGGQRAPTPAEIRQVDRARAAVRRLIEAADGGDPAVCTEVMTLRYVERVTGQKGSAAIERCRKDFSRGKVRRTIEAFGPSEVTEKRIIVRVRTRERGKDAVVNIFDVRLGDDDRWRVDNTIR